MLVLEILMYVIAIVGAILFLVGIGREKSALYLGGLVLLAISAAIITWMSKIGLM